MPNYLISYSDHKIVLRNYEGYITTYEEPLEYQQHDKQSCALCQNPRQEAGQGGVHALLQGERMWIEPAGFEQVHSEAPPRPTASRTPASGSPTAWARSRARSWIAGCPCSKRGRSRRTGRPPGLRSRRGAPPGRGRADRNDEPRAPLSERPGLRTDGHPVTVRRAAGGEARPTSEAPRRRQGDCMSSGSRKKRQSVAQTAGGTVFGFEQQLFRDAPPPQEVVHKARPDAPVPAGDGSLVTLELPDEALPDEALTDDPSPWAGIEEELADPDDPWADYAAETAGLRRRERPAAEASPTAADSPRPAASTPRPMNAGPEVDEVHVAHRHVDADRGTEPRSLPEPTHHPPEPKPPTPSPGDEAVVGDELRLPGPRRSARIAAGNGAGTRPVVG